MAGSADYTGENLFDGMELHNVSASSLYELCSVIQQNVFVFNASIRDNVTMLRSFLQEKLDEATAALDAQTVHTQKEALLRRYDGIFVLKDGRIDAAGSFEELMKNKSYYDALFTVA